MPPTTRLTQKSSKQEKAKSLDEQLAESINKAEHHLIEAALLFEKDRTLRSKIFYDRLIRAQEITTSLNAEELVRKRDAEKRARKSK